MPKELMFLQISEYRQKNNFLRHIYAPEPIHIPVTEKTTNQDVFDALEEKFNDDPEALVAVRSFIDEQFTEMNDQEEKDFRKKKALEVIPEEGINLFAIFDLIPLTA